MVLLMYQDRDALKAVVGKLVEVLEIDLTKYSLPTRGARGRGRSGTTSSARRTVGSSAEASALPGPGDGLTSVKGIPDILKELKAHREEGLEGDIRDLFEATKTATNIPSANSARRRLVDRILAAKLGLESEFIRNNLGTGARGAGQIRALNRIAKLMLE